MKQVLWITPHTLSGHFSKITSALIKSGAIVAVSKSTKMTFSTYHRENLLLKGQAKWPPAVGGFLAAILRLLGNRLPSVAGTAELLFLVPVERADSRADAAGAARARPWPAGLLGTLWTLLCHLQRRLRLAGVRQRSLDVGHWLAGWRHSGNGAASKDSRAGTNGDRGGAVVVIDGCWVVIWGKNRKGTIMWNEYRVLKRALHADFRAITAFESQPRHTVYSSPFVFMLRPLSRGWWTSAGNITQASFSCNISRVSAWLEWQKISLAILLQPNLVYFVYLSHCEMVALLFWWRRNWSFHCKYAVPFGVRAVLWSDLTLSNFQVLYRYFMGKETPRTLIPLHSLWKMFEQWLWKKKKIN